MSYDADGKIILRKKGSVPDSQPRPPSWLPTWRRHCPWHYKAYQREQPADDRLAYAAAEKDAAAARLGLWQDAVPVAPWEWRHPVKVAP